MSRPNKERYIVPIAMGVAAAATLGVLGLARAQSGPAYSQSGTSTTSGASGAGGGAAAVAASAGGGASATPSATGSSRPSGATERTVYTAQLSPANNSGVNATARIVVDGNNVGVFIQASGLDPSVPHAQHIHAGTTCPTTAADTNRDGFVDDVEAEAVSGPPVIALTRNGGTQFDPNSPPTEYPMAAADGALTYIGTFPASLLSLLAGPTPTVSSSASPGATSTPTPGATATETPGPEAIGTATPSPTGTESPGVAAGTLLGHVIEIHGVGTSLGTLPSTVASSDPTPPNLALPVACGVITQVTE